MKSKIHFWSSFVANDCWVSLLKFSIDFCGSVDQSCDVLIQKCIFVSIVCGFERLLICCWIWTAVDLKCFQSVVVLNGSRFAVEFECFRSVLKTIALFETRLFVELIALKTCCGCGVEGLAVGLLTRILPTVRQFVTEWIWSTGDGRCECRDCARVAVLAVKRSVSREWSARFE